MSMPARIALVSAGLACLSAAVAMAAPAAAAAPVEETVRQGTETWGAAYNAGDVETIVALYAPDALVMPPGAARARGHAAIRAYLTQAVAQAQGSGVSLVMGAAQDVGVSGDLAWHSGDYTVTDRKSGAAVDSGNYLEVWRRTGDTWRIVRDIWNSARATPTAPEAAPAR
jgi:uncharacterized protein (TIGR02246 family)